MMSGLASRPSYNAFMTILHALGASSPLTSSSAVVMDPSGTKGVDACFNLSTLAKDL